ncbi:acyloxyacyl hydrolase [Terasakiella sp. SH-1]|uniref:acyloxyacyl hydrolase n=1 Tax=Terasakiella sp. SH-1 TaxID=2560057 RepID=UPI0010731AC7|nr:acyloxyacyl hydrolase [Terasakiella sp. SH-1]
MKRILFALSALLFIGTNNPAQADMIKEVKLGLLDHDTDNLWSGFNREGGLDINGEVILNHDLNFWGGTMSPAIGLSVNSQGDTSKAYLDARWQKEFADDFYFALGVGGAVHNGNKKLTNVKRKALGSKVLFHFPIELGYHITETTNVSLFFDHVSNAWLASPNEGMDTLGIRIGFKF